MLSIVIEIHFIKTLKQILLEVTNGNSDCNGNHFNCSKDGYGSSNLLDKMSKLIEEKSNASAVMVMLVMTVSK